MAQPNVLLFTAVMLLLCTAPRRAAAQHGNATAPLAQAPGPEAYAPPAVAVPLPAPTNGTPAGAVAGEKLIVCTANWEPIAMCKNEETYDPGGCWVGWAPPVRRTHAEEGLRKNAAAHSDACLPAPPAPPAPPLVLRADPPSPCPAPLLALAQPTLAAMM